MKLRRISFVWMVLLAVLIAGCASTPEEEDEFRRPDAERAEAVRLREIITERGFEDAQPDALATGDAEFQRAEEALDEDNQMALVQYRLATDSYNRVLRAGAQAALESSRSAISDTEARIQQRQQALADQVAEDDAEAEAERERADELEGGE